MNMSTRPNTVKKQGLGSLLKKSVSVASAAGEALSLPLDKITPDPHQPRKEINVDSLAASIKAVGVIQPIVVRKDTDSGNYIIVAGERRWLASKQAGLDTIPAIIRGVDDAQLEGGEVFLVQVTENTGREPLTTIELLESIDVLINEYKMLSQKVSEALGIDKSTVSSYVQIINSDLYERFKALMIGGVALRPLADLARLAKKREAFIEAKLDEVKSAPEKITMEWVDKIKELLSDAPPKPSKTQEKELAGGNSEMAPDNAGEAGAPVVEEELAGAGEAGAPVVEEELAGAGEAGDQLEESTNAAGIKNGDWVGADIASGSSIAGFKKRPGAQAVIHVLIESNDSKGIKRGTIELGVSPVDSGVVPVKFDDDAIEMVSLTSDKLTIIGFE